MSEIIITCLNWDNVPYLELKKSTVIKGEKKVLKKCQN